MADSRNPRKPAGGPDAARSARKDRLIQTRVPRELETTLKEEAQRRRLTVSHLIRNILEDTLDIVDGVVADVDQIVSDSMTLARNVGRGARRLGARRVEPVDPEGLSHVYAWNEVVLNRAAACSSCGTRLERGERGFAGLADEPGPRTWLCPACAEALREPVGGDRG